MKIVKLTNAKFGNSRVYTIVNGFALYEENRGFVAFSCDRDKCGILTPYMPAGKKKTLQSILDAGGFCSFDGMEFVEAIK